MSDYKAGDLLASLPSDEREALLRRVSEIMKPRQTTTVRDVHIPDIRRYWHVVLSPFDTVVAAHDVRLDDRVADVAARSLQPWYVYKAVLEEIPYIEDFTHTQYVAWLRRH